MTARCAPADPLEAFAEDMALLSGDPLKWVYYAFEWGEGDLAGYDGPDEWQKDVLREIRDGLSPDEALQIAVSSGHGVGKSCIVAWIILWGLSTCPDARVVVTANTGNQLKTKTWAELAKWHSRCLAGHLFELKSTSVASRETTRELTWRADAIPWAVERSEAFAGLHNAGKRIFVIFDEASAIDDRIWEVTEGALTDSGTEILWLAFGNPTRNTGRFRECFRKYRHRWKHRKVDARAVKITNKTQIDKWIEDHGLESDFVKVRVLGEFPEASDTQLIPVDLVRGAFAKVYRPDEFRYAPVVMGVDVARFGGDACSVWLRQGLGARRLYKKIGIDTMTYADIIAQFIREHEPDAVFLDMGAMGAGVYDRLRQLNCSVQGVQFGSKALKETIYADRRSEMWDGVKLWLKEGGALPGKAPETQDIEDDLTGPEYFYDARGRLRLESKDDMKDRGLPSPDDGDALALTFAAPVAPRREKTEEIGRNAEAYDPLNRHRRR